MKGTNAIVFSYGEVNATAKTLAEFAKDVEVLQIKSGVMDGEALDDAKIKFFGNSSGQRPTSRYVPWYAIGFRLCTCKMFECLRRETWWRCYY